MQNMGIEDFIIDATKTNPTTFVPDGHSYDREADAHKIHSGGKLDSNFSVEDLMDILEGPNGKERLQCMKNNGIALNIENQWKQTALFYADTRENFETLVANGLDPHARNYLNRTVLFNATFRKNREVVKSAVEHGIDVNAQDVRGETALFIAARKRLLYIVKYLLANGADPCIVDKKGKTAQDYIENIPKGDWIGQITERVNALKDALENAQKKCKRHHP